MRGGRTQGLTVPAARIDELVTTTSADEVLVYDLTTHHIHHLNVTTSSVWKLCDGQRTVGQIAAGAGLDPNAVRLALRQLEDTKLLDGPLAAGMRGTQTRRAFMRKAVVAGAAVPLIASISAPSASATQSSGHIGLPTGGECDENSDCASGICDLTNNQCF